MIVTEDDLAFFLSSAGFVSDPDRARDVPTGTERCRIA